MIHWLLEMEMFDERHLALEAAASARGHRVSHWRDAWWETNRFPCVPEEGVLFHGSLGNAARMANEARWRPGAFCDEQAFACTTWYPRAKRWLLNDQVAFTTVRALIAAPFSLFPECDRIFVRPDSPLKPFAGRGLQRDQISAAALDHGYYYDDLDLPIVVSPTTDVGREFRFVIADQQPIAGSSYEPDRRRAMVLLVKGSEWQIAAEIATALAPPERLYILDLCETPQGVRLLELNPFSGADLYSCSPEAVVRAAETIVQQYA